MALDAAGVRSLIGEGKAAGMAQHVGMNPAAAAINL